MKKKARDFLLLLALVFLGAIFIIKSGEVSAAVVESLKSCVFRIVPSLFPMAVLSTAISKSGAVNRLLSGSKLNPDVLTAFIFGNVGGYPIGAKLLCEALSDGKISRETAETAVCFCYSCGPAFAAGIVGSAVFNNVYYGIAALVATAATNLTLFVIFCVVSKPESASETVTPPGFSTSLMTESVSLAANSMLSVCAMIVFFSALKAAAESVFKGLGDVKFLGPILEITNISKLSARDGLNLPIAAALLAFGGICVIFQVAAIVGKSFSLKKFLLSRLIVLPLAAGYAFLFEKLLLRLDIAQEATKIRLSRSPSLIPIFCVMAMVLITLFDKSGRKTVIKKV